MPQLYNGIGTWYYGKKNFQEYDGICQLCRRNAKLSSYDTRLYFVIFLVPIIPLAKKHILEKCSICKRHRPVPLADWKIREQRLQGAIENFRSIPTDPQRAREALEGIAACRDRPRFFELAPEIERTFPRDKGMLRDLASLYESFGEVGQSERLLKNTLAVEDSDESREAVADSLIQQGRPEEAEPYLQHIITNQIPDRVNYLYQLAQGFQAKGNHDKAMSLFAQCELINPGISQDHTFQRLREASAEKIGTNEPIKPAKVIQKIKTSAARRKFFKIAPVVVLVALVAYLGIAFIEGIRSPVYVVNGLSRAYTVLLNGKSYALPPGSATKVYLSEGNVKVEIAGAGPGVPAEMASIHSAFWSRPFSDHAFVLNPDQTAIVNHYKIYYGFNGAPDPEETLSGGQLLHYFDHIDYPFETPPASIETDQSSGTTEKDVLAVFNGSRIPLDVLLPHLAKEIGPDAVTRIAERHLLFEPEKAVYLNALEQLLSPDEIIDFLRPNLARRPILMPWHRVYQNVMMQIGKDEELERDYNQQFANDPKNIDLVYLAGRATIDPDKRLALFQQAAAADPPSPYTFYALSRYYLCNAEFPEAAQNAKRAADLIADDLQVRRYCVHAFIAAGQFDEALRIIQPEEQSPMTRSLPAYMDEMYIRQLQNQPAEAENAISRMRNITQEASPQYAAEKVAFAEAVLAYIKGDTAEFISKLKGVNDEEFQIISAITSGDVKSARETIDKLGPTPYSESLLYLCALQHGDKAVADDSFKKLISLLSGSNRDDREYAAAIQRQSKIPLSQLLRGAMEPSNKTALLIILGIHDPAARDQCFAMAGKLNFDKRFPHLFLKSLLDHPPVN